MFQVKGNLLYKCHNFKEFHREVLGDYGRPCTKSTRWRSSKIVLPRKDHVLICKVNKIVSSKPMFKVDILKDLTPIDSLNTSHPARVSRKEKTTDGISVLHRDIWHGLTRWGKFEDTEHEELESYPFRRRMIRLRIPRSRCHPRVFATLQSIDEEHTKIFGLENIDTSKRVYVVEGPFDSTSTTCHHG